ncbi:MAG TPA: sulfotransferase domain-containing protein [Thermoleophilaceae bacterium]|nr:sulfotransferase domain-containing protein [Thermoleophilaceae bacterium]
MTGQTVWLASYPKSGNTWLRAVYSAWLTGEPPDLNELDGSLIASARHLFDDALGIPSSDLTPDEIEVLRPRADEVRARDATGPLLRKVHDAFFTGPAGEPVLSVAATRSAVYVIRDPRDVAVSLAHHDGKSVEQAAGQLANPKANAGGLHGFAGQVRQRLGTWSEHVRSWTDHAPFPVHVLRYEDCLTDPVPAFETALRAAGLEPVDHGRVAAAVELADFHRLRAAEARDGFRERSPASDRFFRSGRAGSWREEMSADVAASISEAHADQMKRFGYA